MATIINQEPSTREGLAFAYIKFCNLGIMNPSALNGNNGEAWHPGTEGRLLTVDETTAYSSAVRKMEEFFTGSDAVWKAAPEGSGIYLICYASEARIEAVLVQGNMHLALYNMSQDAVLNTGVSGLWFGPLPLPPVMRRVSS